MDSEWTVGAWIEVLNLPAPVDLPEASQDEHRRQMAEYVERCGMVLEDWHGRDAQWLGEFSWGWVDYDRQLAYVRLEVENIPDLRLFVWVNDFAVAGLQAVYILAVSPNGQGYLEEDGMAVLLRRRDEVIARLRHAGP